MSRAPNNAHCSDKGEGRVGGSSSLHLIYFSGAQFPFRVGGFGEFGHQGAVGVDFTGEEFSCALLICSPLTLSKLHWSFFTIGEVGHSKVLF